MFERVYLLLLVLFTLSSCISPRVSSPQIFINDNYCQSLAPAANSYDSLLTNQLSADTILPQEVLQRFTPKARSVASDIGMLPYLSAFISAEQQLRKEESFENKLQMVTIRQEVTERIAMASLEVASVLSELHCEIDRAVELKNHLQLQVDKRQNTLTILSVLAAASATAIGSILNLSDAKQEYIETAEISGAVVSGYFAIRALKKKDIKALFLHKRNYLADISTNPPISQIFQPMVWHFLTKEYAANQQAQTVRETIVERWEELNRLTEANQAERQERMNLMFSEGGKYSMDDIDNRISLLELVVLEVSLMQSELKHLQEQIMLGPLQKSH